MAETKTLEVPVQCSICETWYDKKEGKSRVHKIIDALSSINPSKIKIRLRRKKNGSNG